MNVTKERRVRTWSLVVSLVGAAVALGGWAIQSGTAGQAAETAETAEPTPGVLATVDGQPITQAEVEALVAAQLSDLDRQRQTLLEQGLERAIADKLLAAGATKAGLDPEAYLQQEVAAKITPVTDAEVDAFYEENKARINQPKEEIAGQIREYLGQQRGAQRQEALIASLRAEHKVVTLLEPTRIAVEEADSPSHGPEGAPVTIVEFSDFECPFCSSVNPTLDQVKETYAGKVRLVFRQFPLNIHPNAWKAAEASLCAHEQGRFWEMHDAMFADQKALAVDALKAKATELGLDGERFNQCLDTGKYNDKVQADMAAGQQAGVSGTPALFVNGRFISGAVPFEQISKVIDDELQRGEQAQ